MLNADQTQRPLTSSNKVALVRVPTALSCEFDLSKRGCVQFSALVIFWVGEVAEVLNFSEKIVLYLQNHILAEDARFCKHMLHEAETV